MASCATFTTCHWCCITGEDAPQTQSTPSHRTRGRSGERPGTRWIFHLAVIALRWDEHTETCVKCHTAANAIVSETPAELSRKTKACSRIQKMLFLHTQWERNSRTPDLKTSMACCVARMGCFCASVPPQTKENDKSSKREEISSLKHVSSLCI